MAQNNVNPMVKFMAKKITVRMLEAHFNALPELLRYVIKKGETDLDARMALHNFEVECKKERQCLDPAEAVFGFAANLIQLSEGDPEIIEKEKQILSNIAFEFCKANDLGEPEEGWIERLKMVNPEK